VAAYDSSTALIVVDVQNDFADPNGSLYVSGGETIVPVVNEEVARASDAGAVVVYTQDWHPESTPHFQKDGGIWPVHCVQETWGAAFHPDLEVKGDVVRKGKGGEDGYSGFTIRHPDSGEVESTELADLLKERGIERVVVVGLATDYCVKDTALDALRLRYATTVRTDAMRAVDLQPGDGDRALAEMMAAGARLD
jgi:nicotinamidase/pyrazinamidase